MDPGTLDQQQFLQMAHEGIVSSLAHLISQPDLAHPRPRKHEVYITERVLPSMYLTI